MAKVSGIRLSSKEKTTLNRWLRSTTLPQGQITRAKILLALDEDASAVNIAKSQRISRKSVYKWKQRYQDGGIDGLVDQARPGRPTVLDERTVKKVLKLTTENVPQEATHWSIRTMAEYAGVTTWQVRQIWQAADLKPHRIKTFKISNDPQFAEKVIDIVGLYMNPPTNAVILSVDEKTQIQALDRTQPGLPLSPGRIGSRTHDYKRNGVAALYAAFNVLTGEVTGEVSKQSNSKEFLRFMKTVERKTPKGQELHIILDNLSAHKTPEVRDWLQTHPRVHFHFTPTSSSWLNAVEGWFSQLERRALYRGVFTSVADLEGTLKHFIEVHNEHLAKPFKWTKDAAHILASVARARQALPN